MANIKLTTPERAEYWEKSCKGILVQGWPGLAYFKTRDLRPARNVMSSSSLAFKKATPFHTPHRFPRPVIRVPCRSREASEERLRTGNQNTHDTFRPNLCVGFKNGGRITETARGPEALRGKLKLVLIIISFYPDNEFEMRGKNIHQFEGRYSTTTALSFNLL